MRAGVSEEEAMTFGCEFAYCHHTGEESTDSVMRVLQVAVRGLVGYYQVCIEYGLSLSYHLLRRFVKSTSRYNERPKALLAPFPKSTPQELFVSGSHPLW